MRSRIACTKSAILSVALFTIHFSSYSAEHLIDFENVTVPDDPRGVNFVEEYEGFYWSGGFEAESWVISSDSGIWFSAPQAKSGSQFAWSNGSADITLLPNPGSGVFDFHGFWARSGIATGAKAEAKGFLNGKEVISKALEFTDSYQFYDLEFTGIDQWMLANQSYNILLDDLELTSYQALAGPSSFKSLATLTTGSGYYNYKYKFGSVLTDVGDINLDNVSDLMIGVYLTSVNGRPEAGQVQIFSGADHSLLRSFTAPQPQPFAQFGNAIVGTGDLNGDNVPDYAIGASGWRTVFVFSGATGSLLYRMNGGSQGFATSLAAIGDVNGDKIPDIAVGEAEFVDEGRVFVYSGTSGALIYRVDDPTPSDATFGESIIVVGDVSGDEIADFAVGASGHGGSGQVLVYSGANGNRLYSIDAPRASVDGKFGQVMKGIPDINGDGVPDMIVANYGDDNGSQDQGVVYVFSGVDGRLIYTVEHPYPQRDAQFGYALSVLDDLDGDGLAEWAAVALNQDKTYLFSGANGHFLTHYDGGTNVLAIADTDKDGLRDLAITTNDHRVFLYSSGLPDTAKKITVDIRPYDERNLVVPDAKAYIVVAVLSDKASDPSFEPASQIKIPSLQFGPNGAGVGQYRAKDINGDGLRDLQLRFWIPNLGIRCGDTSLTLTGKTLQNISVSGSDKIKTVRCK